MIPQSFLEKHSGSFIRLGIAFMLIAIFKDTTVETQYGRVHNLGLINKQTVVLILSALLIVIGVIAKFSGTKISNFNTLGDTHSQPFRDSQTTKSPSDSNGAKSSRLDTSTHIDHLKKKLLLWWIRVLLLAIGSLAIIRYLFFPVDQVKDDIQYVGLALILISAFTFRSFRENLGRIIVKYIETDRDHIVWRLITALFVGVPFGLILGGGLGGDSETAPQSQFGTAIINVILVTIVPLVYSFRAVSASRVMGHLLWFNTVTMTILIITIFSIRVLSIAAHGFGLGLADVIVFGIPVLCFATATIALFRVRKRLAKGQMSFANPEA